MYSTIDKKIMNEFMSFKHYGNVIDGKEQPIDEATEKWSGAMENYTLKEKNGKTLVSVAMDITEEYADMFRKIFPEALNKLKEISES